MYEFKAHYQLRSNQKNNDFTDYIKNYLLKADNLKQAKMVAYHIRNTFYRYNDSDCILYCVEFVNKKSGKRRFVY